MVTPKTANQSTKQWQDSRWKLTPFHVPILVTGPAAAPIDIQWVGPGNILPGRRTIDQRTHLSLLDQSLHDYEDIWRDLADR